MYVTVKDVTLQQAKTILKLCIDNQVEFGSSLIRTPVGSDFPHYYYNYDENILDQCDTITTEDIDVVVSFKEFCNYIKGVGKTIKPPFKKDVVLNSLYTATVTKQEVKVGCQTFNHDVIKKLYEAILDSQNL